MTGFMNDGKYCAKMRGNASCGTILCHNRRFTRKWHRDFNPGRGRHSSCQFRAGAVLAGSVPKSRESLPVAQFCATIGVLPENGTEFSIQGEGGTLINQVQAGAAFAGSVPKSRKSLPVAQFCAIIGVLPKNGTEPEIGARD